MAGNLITFEGIDGCGKSTQAQLLFEKLKQTSVECILTREPGGSAGAEEIRNLLVTGTRNRWSAETETLLFTAARRDHIEKIIIPSLKADQTVISDASDAIIFLVSLTNVFLYFTYLYTIIISRPVNCIMILIIIICFLRNI